MTAEDKTILEKLKRKLMEENIPLYDLILFGSRARGDAEPDSDFDILVIVHEKNPMIRRKVRDCAWEVGFESDVVIQSLVRSKAEVDEGPEKFSLFFKAIEQEGIHV